MMIMGVLFINVDVIIIKVIRLVNVILGFDDVLCFVNCVSRLSVFVCIKVFIIINIVVMV